jgi:hypothetical protein
MSTKMATATASSVLLSPHQTGIVDVARTPSEAFETANHFLQKNHDEHHIFWREVAGHNHVAHSILSVYALGGSPAEIKRAFEDGAEIQQPIPPQEQLAVETLNDPHKFRARMGQLDEYPNFLAFFQNQIAEKGWVAVVQEYCFNRSSNSETIFANLLEGLYHPMIHLGLGIEFAQPSIVAEGLAQAASHDSMSIEQYIYDCEQAARENPESPKSLVELYQAVHDKGSIRASSRGFADGVSRVRDGVLARSSKELVNIAAQFRVQASDLQRALAETTNASAYATGATKRPGKEHKIDFFHMHGVTASVLLDVFLRQPWISLEDKIRLVERKGRVDLLWYAASGAVDLNHDSIAKYTARESSGSNWEALYKVVVKEHDDGHLAKLVRALKHGQAISQPFENSEKGETFPVKGDDWFKIAQLGYESTARKPIEQKWVWGVGHDECWALIPSEP